jgi:hypothetical protein
MESLVNIAIPQHAGHRKLSQHNVRSRDGRTGGTLHELGQRAGMVLASMRSGAPGRGLHGSLLRSHRAPSAVRLQGSWHDDVLTPQRLVHLRRAGAPKR